MPLLFLYACGCGPPGLQISLRSDQRPLRLENGCPEICRPNPDTRPLVIIEENGELCGGRCPETGQTGPSFPHPFTFQCAVTRLVPRFLQSLRL